MKSSTDNGRGKAAPATVNADSVAAAMRHFEAAFGKDCASIYALTPGLYLCWNCDADVDWGVIPHESRGAFMEYLNANEIGF